MNFNRIYCKVQMTLNEHRYYTGRQCQFKQADANLVYQQLFSSEKFVHFQTSTWYSVMRVLKQRVKRLILLIFDLSEPLAPVTAAAKYLSTRLF